jgi:hypothetical protein
MSILSDVKDGFSVVLKASGSKTAALAIASGVLIYLDRRNVLGIQFRESVMEGLVIACVAFSSLAIMSGVVVVAEPAKDATWGALVRWNRDRRARKYVASELQHLDDRERQIIAYLLEKNIKSFRTELDGGYAVTLISKNLIVRAQQPGQLCGTRNVPFVVPDYVWDVLVEHKAEFRYRSESALPWAISPFIR